MHLSELLCIAFAASATAYSVLHDMNITEPAVVLDGVQPIIRTTTITVYHHLWPTKTHRMGFFRRQSPIIYMHQASVPRPFANSELPEVTETPSRSIMENMGEPIFNHQTINPGWTPSPKTRFEPKAHPHPRPTNTARSDDAVGDIIIRETENKRKNLHLHAAVVFEA